MDDAVPGRLALPAGRVALLFTDIQGSTALLRELGDAFGDLLDQHDLLLRAIWEEYGGVEVDNEGDAFFVAFPDHEQAVAAASDVVRRCAAQDWAGGRQLRVRMALHSGEPRIRGRHYWGVDVHYAARLCSASNGGQVLLSHTMLETLPDLEVESLGGHALRDFPMEHEVFHLVVDGSRAADFPPPRTLAVSRSNLPSIATPIVGREAVIDEVSSLLLGGTPLVSLVGPGGVGKTRAAIAIGEALVDSFTHGVTFVALAGMDDVAGALGAVTDAFRLPRPEEDQFEAALRDHLTTRDCLLVLDNAEHLPDLAQVIARLGTGVPTLRLLVTSQRPLGVRTETMVRLGPLAVPALETRESVAGAPAVQMLLDRVSRRQPGFAVTEENASSLANLVRRLDGVPLALELAAARVPMTGVEGLLRALQQGLDALEGGPGDLPERQRGLRAALDWTTGLLSEHDRRVFGALGAFASAWTIEQAEQFFSDIAEPLQTWDSLAHLLDLSLLVTRGDGRMTMPERVRRYSREVLADSGEQERWSARHADLMTRSIEAIPYAGYSDAMAIAPVVEELADEIMAAVAWARSADPDALRRLLAVTAVPLTLLGRLNPIADDILRLTDGDLGRNRVEGLLLIARLVVLGRGMSYSVERREAALAALACLEVHGTIPDLLAATEMAVDQWSGEGNFDEAWAVIERLGLRPEIFTNPDWRVEVLHMSLHTATFEGDYLRAREIYDETMREPHLSATQQELVLSYRGDIALGTCDWVEAAAAYGSSLETARPDAFIYCLPLIESVAVAIAKLGRVDEALELLAARSLVHKERMGMDFVGQGPVRELIEQLYAEVDPAVLARAQVVAARHDYESLRRRTLDLVGEVAASPSTAPSREGSA